MTTTGSNAKLNIEDRLMSWTIYEQIGISRVNPVAVFQVELEYKGLHLYELEEIDGESSNHSGN